MKYLVTLTVLLLLVPQMQLYAAEGGGASGGSMSQKRPAKLTPEEKAAVSYNAGLKHRDKAFKYEEKAANETRDKQFKKLQAKVEKEYRKAIADYEKANEHHPHFYEVHNSLGFALRKVGRFDESLAAYDTSLQLNPSYGNAIEYRGQAYLGLNRVEDAKQAYMALFQSDPALAEQLLNAMHEWVQSRRVNPSGLDKAQVEQFAAWVQQRTELASFVRPQDAETLERWAETS